MEANDISADLGRSRAISGDLAAISRRSRGGLAHCGSWKRRLATGVASAGVSMSWSLMWMKRVIELLAGPQ